ncbi:uncharacterized protein BP01DRAFT_352897 [Aspergillus saccharolyticus JOP 1030-1]|uniref:Glyceraldehyde 3-phosphate dehydrogenase n=1 Tax=Aspergillus saccharolyticus JOP 1030-1 TaxID=1450539 RepID=A0A318ZP78_9EURO|nr:hypothetical protein BP01DRAFT_352897 [Aspergillus saccharolyticus JOP 1030-1]PYH49421.1 hypothetical protein BP01DRAFT_352897 [Aspergillus saccharolyticus JOP 1030-1]
MSGFRGVMKEGWHPKGRDGKKEGWKNDFKGINQVAGWMGKGKDKDEREERVAAPLSSLKDPASFGPPPKHIKYHGAGALPNELTPDRRGLGAPLSQEQIHQQNARQQEEEQARHDEAQKPAAPPLPYRVNRTGLDTSNLPPPPVRRVESPAESVTSASSKPKPSVPPRLPSRASSTLSSQPPTPPPAYPAQPQTTRPLDGYLNQTATSNLSRAGISVPALGIGSDSSPSGAASPVPIGQAPVNELQSRFSQMRTTSTSPAPPPPARGSISSDGPSPGPTAHARAGSASLNDFRERHSDKIDAGKQKLNGLNEKYGISQRVNKLFDDKKTPSAQMPPVPPHPVTHRSSSSIDSLGQRKAPPPPPPPKKAEMRSAPVNSTGSAPPPVPFSTKPR